MSSGRPPGERVVLKACVLIGLGVGVGIVDAFIYRPVNMQAIELPPIEDILGSGTTTPDKPGVDGAAGAHTPEPADTTIKQPVDKPVDKPAQTPAVTGAEPVRPEPELKQTPRAELPKNHITIPQAYALYQSDPGGAMGKVIFIDARAMDRFEAGHVAGAYPLNLASFSDGDPPQVVWLRGSFPDAIYVVYCLGGNCEESQEVALLMNNSGLTRTYIMHDGMPAWEAAGYPSEQGKHPFQDEMQFR